MAENTNNKEDFDGGKFEEILPYFYENLFPYDLIYRWLCYGDPDYFEQREIALTKHTESYIRHKAFGSCKDFTDYIKRKNPAKIDIGCVFNVPPFDHKRIRFYRAIEKELVFDIDLTDYDDIRTCCSGANACNKCWKFMVIACQILESILREDFGFKDILWVYSGRRGVHCWVCDPIARSLTNYERASLLDYIDLIEGGSRLNKRVKFPINEPLHCTVKRALKIIDKTFKEFIVKGQDILGTDNIKQFKLVLSDEKINLDKFFEKIQSDNDSGSEDKWENFVTEIKGKRFHRYLLEEVILHYSYPRIDLNVTKRMDHLLKCPFCVHPKTGRISVPFDPSSITDFDLNKVPTIELVLDELDLYYGGVKAGNNANIIDVKNNLRHTSLHKYVTIFERFLKRLENKEELF